MELLIKILIVCQHQSQTTVKILRQLYLFAITTKKQYTQQKKTNKSKHLTTSCSRDMCLKSCSNDGHRLSKCQCNTGYRASIATANKTDNSIVPIRPTRHSTGHFGDGLSRRNVHKHMGLVSVSAQKVSCTSLYDASKKTEKSNTKRMSLFGPPDI